MVVTSHLEHSHSPRPSNLLNIYLLVTIILDVAQTRTLWLASTSNDGIEFTRVFTGSVCVKALLLALESQHKSRWVRWNSKEHSPEETSGLFGIGAFLWLNQLFLTGYKKILTLEDLYPLDQSMSSERLQVKLNKRIKALRYPLGQENGLAKALARALAVPLLLPVGPRIAMTGFQFCQPFLINTLLDYLQKRSDESSRNVGYGLIGATVLIYIGIAVSGAVYWYLQERAMYMVRGALASSVYRKTTESRITTGNDSAALTLMSADVERIIRGCLNIHEFWANTIEVGLACWLLSRQIRAASVAPIIVVCCCVVLLSFLAKVTGPRQKAWMEKIQKRVGLTAHVIGQMKFLKISGLAGPVEGSIQNMRIDELQTGSKFRMTIIFSALLGYTPLCISPVMTFAFSSSALGVNTIFTSISYIILLANPLSVLFQLFPSLLAALACLRRVQAFLDEDGHIDFRKFSDSPADGMAVEKTNKEGEQKSKPLSLIQISNGCFGWGSDKPCLKNISVEIPRSLLTIVIGPVASGKSTLCKALLGETPVTQGQVLVNSHPGRIGYCDQTPFLSNATIRENIVGFATFNQARYEEVIEATVLKPDLAILPCGDGTKVGSNGVVLSGGQKQRVSIARALYLDSEFLIFDDVLSGLDTNTEEQVYRRVFSRDGLLHTRNTTVILCTHSVKRLPSADHIIALGSDGSLMEQGSFRDLVVDGSYVRGLGVSETDLEITQSNDIIRFDAKRSTYQKDLALTTTAKPETSDVEGQGRMVGDMAVYVHYFSRINKIITVAVIFFGIGWGFFFNFTTIWLKFWSEDVASPRPIRPNSFYVGVYTLLQIMTLLSLFLVCMVSFRTMIVQSGTVLHREALRTVINAPLSFFTSTDIGVVTNLFSQDMTLIDGELPQAFLNVVLQLFVCIGMTAVVATSSPFLAITYPFLTAIIYCTQKFYLRTSRQLRLLDLEAKSPLYSLFIDTIKEAATFRAFDWTHDGIALNNRYLDASQRPAYLLAMIQRWLGFILQIVVALLASVVVTLATQLHSNRAFTGASLVTLMNFGSSLSFLVRTYTSLETSMGAISRLKNFGDKVRPEGSEGKGVVPPDEWPTKGYIRIDGVSASYVDDHYKPSQESIDHNNASAKGLRHLALKDLNITIAPGEKVAICGRSGSGKSSMILLLLGLLNPITPHTDNIIIDNIPLHEIDRTTLRQRIIAIPQEPVFLPDGTSFQDNLDPFGTSTKDECRSVLEAVKLWNFIDRRGGLAAGMSADTFSGGQRQLFSLARAVLRRRVRLKQLQSGFGERSVNVGGILLLDEVSSSVDQDTDKVMQRIIMEEFTEYTIIMVSHRLDMVFGFDTVIVMDMGSIVESGRPQVLVETEGSKFRELWALANKR